jgi:hypothetical protein
MRMMGFPEGTNPIMETSVGRILFNKILPPQLPYFNETITVKNSA